MASEQDTLSPVANPEDITDDPHSSARKKRQRVLVDVHNQQPPSQDQLPDVNEYERQRAERIKQNQEKLKQLGLQQMAHQVARTAYQRDGVNDSQAPPKERKPYKPRQPRIPAAARPTRRSNRSNIGEHEDGDTNTKQEGGLRDVDSEIAPDEDALMELSAYFKSINQDIGNALVVDGTYNGWVNSAIIEKYGLPSTSEEAWNSNKNIKSSSIAAGGGKPKGWSNARAFSSTLLNKNPNAYFYRHVAPHEQQAHGEWSQEEHALFLETARKYGVGDKWGLFASHIPQRVGYQCSAYYREVIIPSGLVLDPRWKMTRSGKAQFAG